MHKSFKLLTQEAVPSIPYYPIFLIFETLPLTFLWDTPSAPPTPSEVTALVTNVSTVGVTWQWTSSGSAPDCFNTTTVIYYPDGRDELFLQLSDPAATEATLTDLQCSTNYTITVHTSSGSTDTRSERRIVSLPARGIAHM